MNVSNDTSSILGGGQAHQRSFGALVRQWADHRASVPVAVVASVFDDLLSSEPPTRGPGQEPLALDDIVVDEYGVARLSGGQAVSMEQIAELLRKALSGAGEDTIPLPALPVLTHADEHMLHPEPFRAWMRTTLGPPAGREEVQAIMAPVEVWHDTHISHAEPGDHSETTDFADESVLPPPSLVEESYDTLRPAVAPPSAEVEVVSGSEAFERLAARISDVALVLEDFSEPEEMAEPAEVAEPEEVADLGEPLSASEPEPEQQTPELMQVAVDDLRLSLRPAPAPKDEGPEEVEILSSMIPRPASEPPVFAEPLKSSTPPKAQAARSEDRSVVRHSPLTVRRNAISLPAAPAARVRPSQSPTPAASHILVPQADRGRFWAMLILLLVVGAGVAWAFGLLPAEWGF